MSSSLSTKSLLLGGLAGFALGSAASCALRCLLKKGFRCHGKGGKGKCGPKKRSHCGCPVSAAKEEAAKAFDELPAVNLSDEQLLALDNKAQLAALQELYPFLRDSFISEVGSQYKFPEFALERLKRVFDYNILGGKYNRATLLTENVQTLYRQRQQKGRCPCFSRGQPALSSLWNQALVLGWCIEILQAMFLVADDMMDKSVTRRGKPCWYLVPDVQYDAVNDCLILESFLFFLLRKYVGEHPFYLDLVHLYQSVSLQTQMGQMLDLLSQPQMKKDAALLKNFTLESYKRIVCFKTAIYSFFLPTAGALFLLGEKDEEKHALARAVSIELGEKFQIEDDFLDCFQSAEILGKIGTDIKDHKCSWLVVQALSRVSDEQRKVLEEHYGKEGEEDENKVKQLYRELKLEEVYEKQEEESYQRILTLVKGHESILPQSLFLPILERIHKRQK